MKKKRWDFSKVYLPDTSVAIVIGWGRKMKRPGKQGRKNIADAEEQTKNIEDSLVIF